jgi:hypothetical protein
MPPSSMPPTSGYYGTENDYGYPATNETESEYLESQALIPKDMEPAKKGFLGYALADIFAMFLIFAISMLVFTVSYWLYAFHWHYSQSFLVHVLLAALLGFVLYINFIAGKRLIMQRDGASDHNAMWLASFAFALAVAFILGVALGWMNYMQYMFPYYDTKQLNTYKQVDASNQGGKGFMDAGMINFIEGSRIDINKSIGFLNMDMYCVAPIVSTDTPLRYDFWAVGVNCCTGGPQSFACGEAVHNGLGGGYGAANGGLRLMSVSELPFYRMAVTEADTRYNIQTSHPIFVHWEQDAYKALNHMSDAGEQNFVNAIQAFAAGMLLLIVCASAAVMTVKSKYAK